MSSKRRLRRQACDGKIKYNTQEEALIVIKALRRKKTNIGFLTPYRCKFCRKFHFGHPPKRMGWAIG